MEERGGRGAPRKGPFIKPLLGPLLMVVCGAVTGLFLWRLLMLEPVAPPSDGGRLTHHDRRAVEQLLNEHIERP